MVQLRQSHYDVVVVGAGFGGIYQLKLLLDQGLSVRVIDAAGDVGGTWYWNRYPGAMSDTESYIYRYSWDREDLLQYHWKDHYVKQPEVLAYLHHVVERYDLRKHMQFNTELRDAQWDDDQHVWRVATNTGEELVARYMVTALGLLSKQNYPDIPGLKSFQGEMYHTGNWPQSYDFHNKRVGIIGCGSTGVQVITAIAKDVQQLVCFQRTPQYSVPSGDGPVTQEYRDSINQRYDEVFAQLKNSIVAFGFEESTVPCMSVSREERERKFQAAWDKGNGFRFMFWTFCDITYDKEANEEACRFIRKKIAETVEDPEKAAKLTPHDYYARRPLCDAGYYEQFNRSNVDIVDLKETPITAITETGIQTSGSDHDLDVIIFATGFDAVEGNYTRVAIKGRKGITLKDYWDQFSGPTSYLGCCVPCFPNLFMITGPNAPFTNIPPTLETHVEFAADTIRRAEDLKKSTDPKESNTDTPSSSTTPPPILIEATEQANTDWTDLCVRLAANSLFRITDSWIFGVNIPGKKNAIRFFFGGLANFRKRLKQCVDGGYRGFVEPFGTGGGGDEVTAV